MNVKIRSGVLASAGPALRTATVSHDRYLAHADQPTGDMKKKWARAKNAE